ncbi:MAG: hypothetical protein EXS13_04040 [Planctomycetes bacterium]|nr:hypothetical protein [Planctomycetota bacterium]
MSALLLPVLVPVLLATCQGTDPRAPIASAARLLIVDVDADPLALGGQPGALFAFDPATGELTLVHSSRACVDPVDVLDEPGGALLVLDMVGAGGVGAIVRVTREGVALPLVLPTALVDPTRFARAPDGCVWVADRGIELPGGGGPGAIWRFSADWSSVTRVASGAPLDVPTAIAFVDGVAWLLDADAFRQRMDDYSEGALFRAAQDGSGFAEAGRLHLVSPYSLEPLPDGRFLVADVNADPKVRTRFCGGLYAVARDGTNELFAWSRDFRDPTDATMHGGVIWVTDGSTDPLELGDDGTGKGFAGHGRGAIYTVDPTTRAIRLARASAHFSNPTRVRALEGGPVGTALIEPRR